MNNPTRHIITYLDPHSVVFTLSSGRERYLHSKFQDQIHWQRFGRVTSRSHQSLRHTTSHRTPTRSQARIDHIQLGLRTIYRVLAIIFLDTTCLAISSKSASLARLTFLTPLYTTLPGLAPYLCPPSTPSARICGRTKRNLST
jgi:hypothetical protein